MIDYTLLRKLCAADGISGDEGEVRDLIINEIKDCADEIRIDNLGNILVHKKGRDRAENKLMLSAHMDEVGLMVTDITSDGFLKFDEVILDGGMCGKGIEDWVRVSSGGPYMRARMIVGGGQ